MELKILVTFLLCPLQSLNDAHAYVVDVHVYVVARVKELSNQVYKQFGLFSSVTEHTIVTK